MMTFDFHERWAKLVADAPVMRLVGMRVVTADAGKCSVEMDAAEKHLNPMGTLHGGILCDLADAAMGIAFASTLEDEESFTTLELKINFLRPFRSGALKADGSVVSRGKTVGLIECTVSDEQQRLIARASSTCMVLRGAQAEGR